MSAPADGEDHSADAREPTPPRQAESRAEAMLEEATIVEGMDPADLSTCRVE
jgi:hypothetical protein